MTIRLRLREPGMIILDGGGGGMVSNHHLVLFTHALCQLSYPAADRSVARRMSGTPGVVLTCVRRCGASKSPQDSNGRVAIRFRPKKLAGGIGARCVMSSARMLSSFARATSRQPGRPSEDKMEEKFIVVWTIEGETMSIPHSTQDEALHKAEQLLRKYGCGLEITLHLDEVSPLPAIWFNKKRMRQWCLAGFPAVRI